MPSDDEEILGVLDRAVASGYVLSSPALRALLDHDPERGLRCVLRRARVTRDLPTLIELDVPVEQLRDAMDWADTHRVLLLRWIAACDRQAGEDLAARLIADPEPGLRLTAGNILMSGEAQADTGREALRGLLDADAKAIEIAAAIELLKSDDPEAIAWLEAHRTLDTKLGRRVTFVLAAAGRLAVSDAIPDDAAFEALGARSGASLLAAFDYPAAHRKLLGYLATGDPAWRAAAAEQLIQSPSPGDAFDALVSMLEAGTLTASLFIYSLLPVATRPAVGARIAALAAEQRPASREAARLLDRVAPSSEARAAAWRWLEDEDREIAAAAALTSLNSDAAEDHDRLSPLLVAMIAGDFDVAPGDPQRLRAPAEVAERAVRYAREQLGDADPRGILAG